MNPSQNPVLLFESSPGIHVGFAVVRQTHKCTLVSDFSTSGVQVGTLGRAADSRIVGGKIGMAAVPRHVMPDSEALLPLPCPVCCCY